MKRQVLTLLAAASIGAAAVAAAQANGARIVSGGIALVVPPDSPVQLVSYERDWSHAKFKGRFVVTGPYSVSCDVTDDEKCTLDKLALSVEPDDALIARLPKWDFARPGKALIEIDNAVPFIKARLGASTIRALEGGSIEEKTGYTSIVVDQFSTGIDCDAYWYGARFVAFATVAQAAPREPEGHHSCA
jgi:hypothetical protein